MRKLTCVPILFALSLLLLGLTGCGRSDVELVPVSGRVTYDGGAWPNGGVLYFAPQDVGKERSKTRPMRPAAAQFTPEGEFEVTSFAKGDGLVPGRYVVTVECFVGEPSMHKRPKSAVPPKYRTQATSDFFVDVDPEKSRINVEFNIPKLGVSP
jgi:hypothetical protein